MSPNLTGALLMMASMAAFTVNDSFIKLTDGRLPLPQLLLLRGALATTLFLLLALWLRGLAWPRGSRAWWLLSLRCAAEIGAAYFFLTALLNMPLANVTAILQALPLTVTLGAFLVFREEIGWRRMVAILVGFAGMLLIVRPGTEGFTSYSLYALVAVLFVTLRDLVTRKMPAEMPSLTVSLATSAAVTLWFGAQAITQPWVPVTPDLAAFITGSAIFILGGYFFSVQVMRVGDVGFVAPFRYTSLVFALIIGLVVFDHWPDMLTLLGAGIVVGTGLFTLYRERAVARSR